MRKLIWRTSIAFGIAGLSLAGFAYAIDDAVPDTPKQENEVANPAGNDANTHAPAAADLRDADHMNKQFSVRRLSQLTSGDIKNDQGKDLGKITGIVLDSGHHRIAYAILSFGGFLGVGDKEFAVPWSALQKKIYADKFDKISYTLNVDKDRLKNAQGFEKDKWPNFADRTWAHGVYQFWGQQPYWERERSTDVTVRSDQHGVDVNADHNSPTIQGTPISPSDRSMQYYPGMVRADKLVGHNVLDNAGRDFAKVNDVMVDPESGRLVYAILQVHKTPDLAKDYLNPIPIRLLQIQSSSATANADKDRAKDVNRDENIQYFADKDAFKVVFAGTSDQLNNGPKFPEREWPMMDQNWGKQVFSHYGVNPFWEHSGRSDQDNHSR